MKSHGQCCALGLKPQGQKSWSLLHSFFSTMTKLGFEQFFFHLAFFSELLCPHPSDTEEFHFCIVSRFSSRCLLFLCTSQGWSPVPPVVSDMSTGRFAALLSSEGLISAHPFHGTKAILTSCRPWCLREVVVDTMLGVIQLSPCLSALENPLSLPVCLE